MNSYREGQNPPIPIRPAIETMVELQKCTKKGSNNKEEKIISGAEQIAIK